MTARKRISGRSKTYRAATPDHRRQHQVGGAPLAPFGRMDDDLVRVLDAAQMRARGTGLLAGLATISAPLPRGGGRLAEPIGGLRLEELPEWWPSCRSSSTTRTWR
jgi:hypothetical protein